MEEKLLDAKAVAKYLGVSLRTFETLIKAGNAPSFTRLGRQRRWRWEDIQDFLNLSVRKNGNPGGNRKD